jgi:hypothetical protein
MAMAPAAGTAFRFGIQLKAYLVPIYTNSDFQCRMRQPHSKIGIILFLCGVRCDSRIQH